jgi:NADH-quinone oxidoreductase subunit E
MNIDIKDLAPIIREYSGQEGSLIEMLQKTQEKYGYIPGSAITLISQMTHIKPAKILGVVTFYAQFKLKPVGKYEILLCQGTACHVNGSETIQEALSEELGIKCGDTTQDGVFTLSEVACLGCCSLSPVMMINGETHGNLTPDKAKDIIAKLRAKEAGA